MPVIDKDIIKRNFSRSARYYDLYSDIQDISAKELISRVDKKYVRNILDIGCGTGSYTKLLIERFPAAAIKAVDISRDMIEIARKKLPYENVEFIIADGEEMPQGGRFDLITSNASLHWFRDLKKALSAYKQFLSYGGLILFSMFGGLTFCELNSSLKKLFGENAAVTAETFAGKKEIENILRDLFGESSVEEMIYKKRCASLRDLLNAIKYTGTRGAGVTQKSFWTAKTLSEIEKIYIERFNGIEVTYQVFFCKGL